MALWQIRATVDDRPGYLSVLTASLALRSVNILAVQVHTTEAGAVDDFLVDAPDALTEADLQAAIARGRGREAFVSRAEAEGLADQPTRALALAGRLAHDPDALGEALISLLDAAEVRWRPEPPAGRPGFDDNRMRLADPLGGSYEVLRPRPAFTPAEFARARALAALAGTIQRRQDERITLLLPSGSEVVVRPASADDLEAVRDLHGLPDARLRRRLSPAGGVCLVAEEADEIVATASVVVEGDVGEISVLVDARWQRRGLGTALARRLLAWAGRNAVVALVAHVRSDDVAMLRTLRRLGGTSSGKDSGTIDVTLPVPAPALSEERVRTS
jgi:RimJ/RimL family protein N-acetyltransferase